MVHQLDVEKIQHESRSNLCTYPQERRTLSRIARCMRHAAITATHATSSVGIGGAARLSGIANVGAGGHVLNATTWDDSLKRPRPVGDDADAVGGASKRHESTPFPMDLLTAEEQALEVGGLDMDDFLPAENGGNWLLEEIDDTALNSGTHYLELQDAAANDPPSAVDLFEQPFPVVQSQHASDAPQLSDNHVDEQVLPRTPPPVSTSPPAPTEKSISDASQLRQAADAGTKNASVSPQPSRPSPRNSSPSYSDVQAPDITTYVFQPPSSSVHSKPPTPTSGAVPILPRNDSKPDRPLVDAKSRSRTTSRKRSRKSQSVSSSPPAIATAVPVGINPTQIASTFASAMAATQASPGSVPHPMAAPLLFAQGLQSPPAPTQQQPQSGRGTPTPPPALGEAPTQGKPSAKFVPVQRGGGAVNSGSPRTGGNTLPHAPPTVPPGMQPIHQNMMQMDPASLMYMAQQMWNTALAMTGSNQVPQNAPSPTRPPFFNVQPPAFNAQPPVYQQPIGGATSAPNVRPTNSSEAVNNGRMRPLFITEDGKHVVVEQLAPAKLMRHPVLGRLQLQSKQQAAMEQVSNAQRTILASPGASTSPDAMKMTESEGSPAGSTGKDRRKRLVWTPELHDRFLQAISAVGIHQAVPKTLVQIMNVEGLTTEHVKSHLQKYRNSLRKAACDGEHDKLKDTSMRALGNSRTEADIRVGREVRVVPCRSLVLPQHSAPPHVQLNPAMSIPTVPVTPTKKAAASSNASIEVPRVVPSVDEKPVVKVEKGDEAQGDNVNKKDIDAVMVLPPTERFANKEGKSDAVRSSDGDEEGDTISGTPEQMHERTMQLQYELQVLVHRTLTLQKQLQVTIGNQGDGESTTTGNMEDTSKEQKMTREEMEKECEWSLRQSEKLREEIGKIQLRLGNKKKTEGPSPPPTSVSVGGTTVER